MRTIYFVRHCESIKTGSDRGRGLTDAGQEQAQELVAFFQALPIDAIYSSPMQRAMDSVRPLAEQRDLRIYEAAFQERRFQETDERLSPERLEELLKRSFQNDDYAQSGGESNQIARNRVLVVIDHLRKTHPHHRVVVATHGLVLALVLEHYTGRPANEWLGAMGSPAIHQLTFDAGGKTSHEQLL
ncbi:histidine phosphatase family protein [Exiguobacterium sp. JMULE1]|uniref:histidine phosphatase family protein n=1 Tax=Exiguobacterium sp. JMULE1 TaxID=2518339 RepID=UPI0015763650|nr:histidine phosphatase family protein [Exiguobacterium sp. JMULE1]NTY09631.1 histidine phosphatase family protein [Exiguobacterium sp. JMULE1]